MSAKDPTSAPLGSTPSLPEPDTKLPARAITLIQKAQRTAKAYQTAPDTQQQEPSGPEKRDYSIAYAQLTGEENIPHTSAAAPEEDTNMVRRYSTQQIVPEQAATQHQASRTFTDDEQRMKQDQASPQLPTSPPQAQQHTFIPDRSHIPPPRNNNELDTSGLRTALVGHDPDGNALFDISFQEDTLAGLHCQLQFSDQGLTARFFPSDHGTYERLKSEIDVLRGRLIDKGLQIEAIEIVDPNKPQ